MTAEKHLQSATRQVEKTLSRIKVWHPELLDRIDRELLRIIHSLTKMKAFVKRNKNRKEGV